MQSTQHWCHAQFQSPTHAQKTVRAHSAILIKVERANQTSWKSSIPFPTKKVCVGPAVESETHSPLSSFTHHTEKSAGANEGGFSCSALLYFFFK